MLGELLSKVAEGSGTLVAVGDSVEVVEELFVECSSVVEEEIDCVKVS